MWVVDFHLHIYKSFATSCFNYETLLKIDKTGKVVYDLVLQQTMNVSLVRMWQWTSYDSVHVVRDVDRAICWKNEKRQKLPQIRMEVIFLN